MATDNGPPERDVKDFKFQQLCKIRISPSSGEIKTDRLQWLATSSRFGFTFIGEKSGFQVIKTRDILILDQRHAKDRSNIIIEDFPVWSRVELSVHVSHLALSCDELTLVVAVKECANLMLLAYDLRAFANPNAQPAPFQKVKLNATPGASLLDLAWNPANPVMLATCVSDGSCELLEIKENLHIVASLPVSACATCLCWSPKGKQIVIGIRDGSLIQFDQELKAKKKWGCPSILDGSQQVVDIAWLSTYMFLAAYVPQSPQSSDQPYVVLTISSKEGKTEYFNYEDICYGSGENRKHKYYISFIQQWELAVIASSNATETTIVGKNMDNKTNWEHWTLEDCGRAELPLADSECDSFPVAMAIDFSSQMPVSLGDNKTHPPSPVVLLLSTDGLLVPFHMLYLRSDVDNLTRPPEDLPTSGERKPRGQIAQAIAASTTAGTTGQPLPFGQTAAATTATSGLPLSFGQKAPALGAATTASSLPFGQKPAQPAAMTTAAQPVICQTQNQQKPQGFTSNQFALSETSAPSCTAAAPLGTASAFGQSQAAVTTASKFSLPTTGNSFQFVSKPTQQVNQTPNATAAGSLEFSLKTTKSATVNKPAPTSSPVPGFTFSTQPSTTTVSQSAASGVPLFQQTKSQSNQTGSLTSSAGHDLRLTTPQKSDQNKISSVATDTLPEVTVETETKEPASTPSLPKPAVSSTPVTTTAPADENAESAERVKQRTQSANELIEITFAKSIIEEMQDFTKELKAHKKSVKFGMNHVGTKEEMQKLKTATEEMTHFCSDIKDTTKEQSREVHDLKTMCMDMFAMTEECRIRQQRNTDSTYHQLLRSRALDPASAEKLRELQQQYQQLQQGLQEVDFVLDAQWDEYKKKKASKGRIQAPTKDAIYRVVKNNCNLIEGHKNRVDNIEEHLKHLKLYNRSSGCQNTNNSFSYLNNSSDLTSLVESLDKQKPQASSTVIFAQSSPISPEKQAKLREYLSRRIVPRVKSTAPANLSMSKIVAARSVRDALAVAEEEKINKAELPPATPLPKKTESSSKPPKTQPSQLKQETPKLPKSSQSAMASFAPTAFTGQAFFKKLTLSTGTSAPTSTLTTTTSTVLSSTVVSTAVTSSAVLNNKSLEQPASGFNIFNKNKGSSKGPATSETAPPASQPVKLTSEKPQIIPKTCFENITPERNTPESDEQEGLTGEDDYEDDDEEYYEDDEEDDDEDEAGFGPQYELSSSVVTTQSENLKKSQNDESRQNFQKPPAVSSEQISNKPALSKNLFGSDSASLSISQSPKTAFSFGGSASSNTSKTPATVAEQRSETAVTSVKDTKSNKDGSTKSAAAAGFSFSTPTVSASLGFSFKMAPTNSSGFSFGGDVGIFSTSTSQKSEPSKTSSSTVSAFGGGSFGGTSPTTASPSSTNTESTVSAFGGGSFGGTSPTAASPSSTNTESTALSAAPGSLFMTPESNKGVNQTTDTSKSVLPVTTASAENDDRSNTSTPVVSATSVEEAAVGSNVTTVQPDITSISSSNSGSAKSSILEGLLGAGLTTSASSASAETTVSNSVVDKTSTTAAATVPQTTSTTIFGGGESGFGSSFASLSASITSEPTSTASVSSQPLFSSQTASATTSASLFGGGSKTTSASIFGGLTTTTATSTTGFGTETSAFSFGRTAKTTESSIFGGGTSLFGGSATTSSPSSVFGTTTQSSVFGSVATSSSPSSMFGSTATTTAPAFGSNTTSVFGGKSTTPTSIFGGNSTSASSVFGSSSAFGAFGSSSSSAFGTATANASEGNAFGGGSLFEGLGGKPSAEKANTNVFGGNQAFGTSPESHSSLFGKQNTSFGSPNTSSNVFGSGGSFTSGGGSVASSGFGLAPNQQPSVSFGGGPAFGTSSAFGSKAAFGSAPTFGTFGSPTFSNPVGAFGSSAATSAQGGSFAGFAGNTSPTFGALAQSTEVPTFGDMAQKSAPFGGSAGFGTSSPAPVFGGSSSNANLSPQFTSYRG